MSNHISFMVKLFPIRLFSCMYYLVLKGNCWLEKYLGCPVISLPDLSVYFSNEYISVNYFVSNHISFTVKLFPIRLFSCMYYLVLKGNCWLEKYLECPVDVSLYFSDEYISVNYSVSNHISFTIKLFPIHLFSCMYYLVLMGNC